MTPNSRLFTAKKPSASPRKIPLTTVSSLVVPGFGQFWLGQRGRGVVIFLCMLVSAFLVNWSQTKLEIGQISLLGYSTSWLWLLFIAFWAWNVYDAQQTANGKPANILPGVAFLGVMLYVIAWNVTDVKLDRLVTRFGDAQRVMRQLANPELALTSVNGEDKVCSWACLAAYTGDRLAGREPTNPVKVSTNLQDIFGKVVQKPASAWRVRLGLAEKGQVVNTFIAGKLIETIAIGLMATLFSTILAIPISFLAARNMTNRVPRRHSSLLHLPHGSKHRARRGYDRLGAHRHRVGRFRHFRRGDRPDDSLRRCVR